MNEEIEPLKVYVGWDSREDIAYQVCKQSILDTTSVPVDIVPLKQHTLRKDGIYTREIDELASTEFTFTRFLVPRMKGYKGWALFIDCDFVFLDDIANLFSQADDRYALMCAQHDYTPKEGVKMDGKQQTQYPRKNWSSMMLINCGHPSNQCLTEEFVNDETKTGAYLHRFSWLNDNEIGNISYEWNWLVGWYKSPKHGSPKALHYTEGGPWFEEYQNCEYNAEWYKAKSSYLENALNKKQEDFSNLLIKRNRDKENNISDRLTPSSLILDDQKKNLVIDFFNYLKDPNGAFYKSDYREKIMAIRGDRVAAIFPESLDDEYNFNPQKKNYEFDEYLEALVQGIPNGVLSTWENEKTSQVPLLIRGLGKKSQLAIKDCWKNNRTFYAIDSGYLGNETTKSKIYHRITKNNLQHLGPVIPRPTDRLAALKYTYKKFKPGHKILICPPSEKVMKFWGQPTPEQWTKNTIRELRKYTDRPAEIRLKPQRNERISNKNIVQALEDNVHCLVTYNSIAATEALLNGTPAIALGPNSASVLCNTSLSEIEDLNTYSKDIMEAYAAHLSYCQFTRKEMQDGTAWRILNESD